MRLTACLLLICACALHAQQASDAPKGNRLKNPGFEDGGDAPAPWKFATARPDNFEAGLSSEARTGKRSARIVTKTRKMSGYWAQTVTVKPDTDYLLECWVKLKAGKLLMYITGQTDEQSKKDRTYITSAKESPLTPVFLKPEYLNGIAPADDWYRVELRFRTLPTTKEITVNIGSYFHPGEVLIDDARLIEAPPAAEKGGAQ